MMNKTKAKELKVGKSYKINVPNCGRMSRIHIDNIMKNPCYSPSEGTIDNSNDLIVFRHYTNKRGWTWYVEPYWVICIHNDWNYKI